MNLGALYNQTILQHSKAPQNFGVLPHPSRTIDLENPVCGDQLTLYLDFDGKTCRNISFTGRGCAIFLAAASVMTTAVLEKTADDIKTLATAFDRLLDGQEMPNAFPEASLQAFAFLAQHPVRRKCARLPWDALLEALEK